MKKIDPREAELIKAHILKKPREWVVAYPDEKITNNQETRYKRLVKQRERGVPLAYLLGKKEFFGLNFFVNKNVLIPRPETELMVEKVIQEIKKLRNKKIILIDVGTGSGCIPIAIAKNLETKKLRNLETFVIDISKSALSIAKKNTKKHQVKIKFLHGDLLKPFTKTYTLTNLHTYKLIITANLPYLTPRQFTSEPSIHHEPRLALVAGKDGLKYYRLLIKQIKQLTTDYSLQSTVFCEIDPSQTVAIKKLIKKHLPRARMTIHKDLAGRERVVELEDPGVTQVFRKYFVNS